MQSGDARFEAPRQARRSFNAGDVVQEAGAEEAKLRNVNSIARRKKNMVVARAAVVQLQVDATGLNSRAGDRPPAIRAHAIATWGENDARRLEAPPPN